MDIFAKCYKPAIQDEALIEEAVGTIADVLHAHHVGE